MDANRGSSGGERSAGRANEVDAGSLAGPLARAESPAPHQLPRAATCFTDRAAEIDRLNTTARQESSLAVVSGQAGVGKSALVVWWAHQAMEQFPDGQLYTDLRGYHSLPPQRPEEALHSFLLALDAPMDNLLGNLDAMAAKFRSLLHGRRMLIIADNARRIDQVLPLLASAPGCCTVVTSRSNLEALEITQGASCMTLRPLPQRDAVTLFSLMSGQAESQQITDLISQCGSLPLTVRIAAQQARTPDDVTALVQDLSNTANRLSTLSSPDEETGMHLVLSWSYNGLTPAKARAFRLLALHAGPDFSTDSAAALIGVPRNAALRLLRALKSDNLLEEVSDRRFRFHDLIRDYAQERVLAEEPESERDAAVRRELLHYLRHCDRADRLLVPQRSHVPMDEEGTPPSEPDFADNAGALAWCDAEIVNLAAAVDQAMRHRMHDMAWKVPIALIYYLVVRHHHAYRHDLSITALQAARLDRNDWAETWALICLGGAAGAVGRHAEAAERFTAALNLSRRTGDLKWESIATYNLAWTLRVAGRYEEAYVQQKRALEQHRHEDDQRSQAISRNELGTISLALGKPEQAREHCLAALHLARVANDLLTEAAALHQLGDANGRLQDLESAADWYSQAVTLRRRTDDRPGLAHSLVELGRLRIESHRAEARAALTEALRLLELLEDPLADEVRRLLHHLQ
ncbi:tetratricopeptide repeat protein [Streptomyces sp. ADMS]|uniref:tetratricopeptide repeat protein n=1 Tax=Streptomyces sp. ADMS TaxID=3071415 RepID=UPI00296F4905|nr:tetratricopeptide repeat protein [Streptomyces sp. ADMS]MDW4908169.1 tetratricopeptide repeat protein [Streptomyces sp. ADMS]